MKTTQDNASEASANPPPEAGEARQAIASLRRLAANPQQPAITNTEGYQRASRRGIDVKSGQQILAALAAVNSGIDNANESREPTPPPTTQNAQASQHASSSQIGSGTDLG
jgi:hypothetical protein